MEGQLCRFVNINEKGIENAFFIKSGGTIFIEGTEKVVTYIDDYHINVGGFTYHIFQFYENLVRDNNKLVIPGEGLMIMVDYHDSYRLYKEAAFSSIIHQDFGPDKVPFTFHKIIRESLPLGRYAYDLRNDDEDWTQPTQIGKCIWVNRLGTIILKQPIIELDEIRSKDLSDCPMLYAD